MGAPPVIVVVDPDPIVTYGQDDFILCIEVEDPDQGGEKHDVSMWLDPSDYQVSTELVLWNLNGTSQTFCWTTWGTVQNAPVRTAYLHIEAVDNLGNPAERVVQWRALP